MPDIPRLGKHIRSLRHKLGITQAAFAQRIDISASYLNLLEHDRRPVTTGLLLKLAHTFDLDLRSFVGGEGARLAADLSEVFGDPMFEAQEINTREVRDLADHNPDIARAVLRLHHAYVATRSSLESLAERVLESQDITQDLDTVGRARLSSEQVSDYIERHGNHFPELEAEAERIWRDGDLERENLYGSLVRYLERAHGVSVVVLTVTEMRGAVRRYDAERKRLVLSEVLRRGSRNFQLAHQIGLLNASLTLDHMSSDPQLTTDESRALCRVAMANYIASATLMPYEDIVRAAEQERYDLELLGHRFRVSFEQVCHRMTALRRPGAEGVSFHMVRVDIAGNLSKKFAPAGIRFPRFSGLCPLWNVHAAFLQPGMIRTQVSRLPDGTAFFSVARTVRRHSGDYRTPHVLYAIALGCDIASARRLVYADGIDLSNADAAVPVGITCRTCERMDCQARAFPALHRSLTIDENVRGVSFFAPVVGS